jgi:arylsulfatase
MSHVPADVCPPLGGRPWTLTAYVVTDGDTSGVIYARGSHNVGHSFFIHDGQLQFDYNAFGNHTRVAAPVHCSPGAHTLVARFDRVDRSGTITVAADGIDLASAPLPMMVRMLGSTGLDIGRDALSPVVDDYEAPFPFQGTIERVVFEIHGRRSASDLETHAQTEMSRE